MGRIARIAHPGSRDTAATEVSVNSRGQLIAAWVHDDGASSPRTSPGSARFVPAKLIVALCRPALQCGSPETIRLGTTKPACINPAVALSPQGAATVIAAAADWGTGCDKPLGVWASVTAAGAANLQPMQEIQAKGDWPIAEPVGRTGTAMVFNSGLASSDSFSSSFLRATGVARSQTSLLDHGGFWNTGQQLLAPATNGWYVITWSHANRRVNPNISLNAGRWTRRSASAIFGRRRRDPAHLGVSGSDRRPRQRDDPVERLDRRRGRRRVAVHQRPIHHGPASLG
jgi:hypothetical protein